MRKTVLPTYTPPQHTQRNQVKHLVQYGCLVCTGTDFATLVPGTLANRTELEQAAANRAVVASLKHISDAMLKRQEKLPGRIAAGRKYGGHHRIRTLL